MDELYQIKRRKLQYKKIGLELIKIEVFMIQSIEQEETIEIDTDMKLVLKKSYKGKLYQVA